MYYFLPINQTMMQLAFLKILLEKSQELISKVDTDLLEVALKQKMNSRIMCILNTLNIIKAKHTQDKYSNAGVKDE